jgi:hypothetical protein
MSLNEWQTWCWCIILMINIFNYIIVKIWYFENIYRDESNSILYGNIYFYLLVENYDQNNMCE